MATFINKRINNTTNTKEDTSMENKIMYIQQTNSIATMLPGGGMIPLMMGMISGVYTSLCVSTSAWVLWSERKPKAKKN